MIKHASTYLGLHRMIKFTRVLGIKTPAAGQEVPKHIENPNITQQDA